jgi:hypothetical protein
VIGIRPPRLSLLPLDQSGDRNLMSEIMHSYLFVPVIDEDIQTWSSFFGNSYNKRDEHRLLPIKKGRL